MIENFNWDEKYRIEAKVKQGLAEFNRWHGPEAMAELVGFDKGWILAQLSGPFCRTCGLYDYFDDLKVELEKTLQKRLKVARVESGGGERYLVTYMVMDNG